MIGWIIFAVFLVACIIAGGLKDETIRQNEEKKAREREHSRVKIDYQKILDELRETLDLLHEAKKSKAAGWASYWAERRQREDLASSLKVSEKNNARLKQANSDLVSSQQAANNNNARLKQANNDIKRENKRLREKLEALKEAGIIYQQVLQQSISGEGASPLLQYALEHRKDECAEILIEAGSEINACSSQRKTPLHAATYRNRPVFCQELIQKGAALNCADEWGKHPLHYAAEQNSVESAEVLINAGALLDVRDNDRNTPLHCACRYGSYNVARLLVQHCGITSLLNLKGQDPYDCFLQSTDIHAKKRAALKSGFDALLHVSKPSTST